MVYTQGDKTFLIPQKILIKSSFHRGRENLLQKLHSHRTLRPFDNISVPNLLRTGLQVSSGTSRTERFYPRTWHSGVVPGSLHSYVSCFLKENMVTQF